MSLLSDTETPAPALTRAGGHWSGEETFQEQMLGLPLPENACSCPHGNGGGDGGEGGGNHISAGLSLNYCLLSPSNRQDGALPSR